MGTFTPVESTVGGILIGLSSIFQLYFVGRITGMSGTAAGFTRLDKIVKNPCDWAWRAAYVLGLLFGGFVLHMVPVFEDTAFNSNYYQWLPVQGVQSFFGYPLILFPLAGFLVGFGTQLGSGCTSGHMICGVARLSPRSIVATATFCLVALGIVKARSVDIIRRHYDLPLSPPGYGFPFVKVTVPSWDTGVGLAVAVVVIVAIYITLGIFGWKLKEKMRKTSKLDEYTLLTCESVQSVKGAQSKSKSNDNKNDKPEQKQNANGAAKNYDTMKVETVAENSEYIKTTEFSKKVAHDDSVDTNDANETNGATDHNGNTNGSTSDSGEAEDNEQDNTLEQSVTNKSDVNLEERPNQSYAEQSQKQEQKQEENNSQDQDNQCGDEGPEDYEEDTTPSNFAMVLLICFFNAFVFALGLGFSGMTKPQKVAGFFDFFQEGWDPSLFCVAGFAVLPAIIVFQAFILRQEKQGYKPLYCNQYHLPKSKKITPQLVIGAILFGLGWGMAGLCPGPTITNLTDWRPEFWLWTIGMVCGFYTNTAREKIQGRLTNKFTEWRKNRKESTSA